MQTQILKQAENCQPTSQSNNKSLPIIGGSAHDLLRASETTFLHAPPPQNILVPQRQFAYLSTGTGTCALVVQPDWVPMFLIESLPVLTPE